MDKKMPKKISLKDFGMEKIILIAIAGIVLLAANFSEWKNSSSKTSEKQEKSVETSQNDAYVEALENKLVHILENVDGVGKAEVMITLKSSKESVLNKDLSEEKQTEEEKSGETQKVNKNQKKAGRDDSFRFFWKFCPLCNKRIRAGNFRNCHFL